MRTAAVIAQAAALGSIRAGLAAIFLVPGNRAGAFGMSAFVLDCFGHSWSPDNDWLPVLRCKGPAARKFKQSWPPSFRKYRDWVVLPHG
jgi:hypothetical protein